MKNIYLTILITCFLLFLNHRGAAQDSLNTWPELTEPTNSSAQDWVNRLVDYDDNWSIREQEYYRGLIRAFELKEGALVVRISTNHRKISTIQRLINNPNVSNRSKRRLRKKLKRTKQETEETAKQMLVSFITAYHFSALYFMYDTSTHHLKSGKKQGYFLNKQLEIDSTIKLKEGHYFTCDYGNVSSHRALKGVVIKDKDSNVPPIPFPGTASGAGYNTDVIGDLLGKKGYLRGVPKSVKLLNKRLEKFVAKGLERFNRT